MEFKNSKIENIKREENFPLKKISYSNIGSISNYVFFPKSIQELKELLIFLDENNQEYYTFGNLSNLIMLDEYLDKVAIITTEISFFEVNDKEKTLKVSAGDSFIEATKKAQKHSLSGIEWAAGIPGTIGGAIFMNAGAYGGFTQEYILSVESIDHKGNLIKRNIEELEFDYRKSVFQNTDEVIISATFQLEEGNKDLIQEKMDHFNLLRRTKQPLEYPSIGSVFKRPEGYYAGKLITDSELKGFSIGDAQVSTKHAGFIINTGDASGQEYLRVIRYVQKTVYEKFGVMLEKEVRIIGKEEE